MLLDTKTRSNRIGLHGGALALGLTVLLTTSTWAIAAALPQASVASPQLGSTGHTTTTIALVSSPQETRLAVGSLAPNLSLADGLGKRTSLHELRGQVVVLDFWADWCRFCNEAVPALRALETEYEGDDLAIVGVSVDHDREAFDRFLTKHELSWPQHHASDGMRGSTATTYGVRALPLHVVIDRAGRIAASGVQLAQLRPTIDALLDGEDLNVAR